MVKEAEVEYQAEDQATTWWVQVKTKKVIEAPMLLTSGTIARFGRS